MESNVTQEVAAWQSKQPNLPEEQRRVETLLAKRLNRSGGREVYELRRRVWEEYLALLPYAREYAQEHKYINELREYWTRIQSFINYLSKGNTELAIQIDNGNITKIMVSAMAAKKCVTIDREALHKDDFLVDMLQTELYEAGYFHDAKNRLLVFRVGDDDNSEVRNVINTTLAEVVSNNKVVGGSKRARMNGEFWCKAMPLYQYLTKSNVFKDTIPENNQSRDTVEFIAELFNVPTYKNIKKMAIH